MEKGIKKKIWTAGFSDLPAINATIFRKKFVHLKMGVLCISLQAGIEFRKNLRVRFGKYGGLKLEYF